MSDATDAVGCAVPDEVDDSEVLARRCEKSKVSNGSIKWRVFISTRFPLELSHDRADHGDPWKNIAGEPHRTLVFLVAGQVRLQIPHAEVRPDKPPEDHALVCNHVEGIEGTSIPSRTELDSLKRWDEVVAMAKALTNLATLDRPPRGA